MKAYWLVALVIVLPVLSACAPPRHQQPQHPRLRQLLPLLLHQYRHLIDCPLSSLHRCCWNTPITKVDKGYDKTVSITDW